MIPDIDKPDWLIPEYRYIPYEPPKWRLYDVLKNRRWERHSYPFDYIYAQDVFNQDIYDQMVRETQGMLANGLSETPVVDKFSRSMSGYDAYGVGLRPEYEGTLGIFGLPEWHDMMAALFGVRGAGYINPGLHYHLTDSGDGEIHNDLNPCWFPVEGKGRLRYPGANCAYQTGAGTMKPEEKIEVARGVVMIFYLNNGEWSEGDGGETGFYRSYKDKLHRPTAKIPPLDNSIIMYECTPKSYHSFLSNRTKPRTSCIMWVHRPMEEAIEKFGADKMEYWKYE